MAQSVEKRKERRIKVNIPIKIIFQKSLEISGKTENLSRLGAYVETDKEIPAGAEVDVILGIPKYKREASCAGEVRCTGNVFRCGVIKETGSKKYYGIGVFFVDFFKEADREKLSRYIDFLILKEDQEIKEGVQYWQDKRRFVQEARQSRKDQPKQKGRKAEVISLLKDILVRVEEIQQLLHLQPRDKTK